MPTKHVQEKVLAALFVIAPNYIRHIAYSGVLFTPTTQQISSTQSHAKEARHGGGTCKVTPSTHSSRRDNPGDRHGVGTGMGRGGSWGCSASFSSRGG